MTSNNDREPEAPTASGAMTHEQYMTLLQNDPRAKKLGKPRGGFVIVGLPRHDQK
jgi:hypothetical protein